MFWLWLFLSQGLGQTSAFAELLSLEDILKGVEANAYDLQIAEVTVEISKAGIQEARADYWPTLKGQINTEYLKDLTSGPNTVTSVGNTVLPTGTRFQNSVGVQANQTLYTFGARKQKVKMAKFDMASKEAAKEQTSRDLRAKVVDLYLDTYLLQQSQGSQESLLPYYQALYKIKQRLFDAGTVSKVEVSEAAIQVTETLDEIQTAKEKRQAKLIGLTQKRWKGSEKGA